MKKTLIGVILATMVFAAYGEESQESKEVAMKSKTALIFDFNGLKISGYEGGIGIKRWLSKSTALVAGIQGYLREPSDDDSIDQSGSRYKQSNIGLLVALEKHFGTGKKLSPFWGAGLGFGKDHSVMEYLTIEKHLNTTDYSNLYIAPRVFIGGELFVVKNVSLSGRYSIEFKYNSATNKHMIDSEMTEVKVKTLTICAGVATLTLAIYL